MKQDNRRKFHRIDFDGKVSLNFTDDSFECCQIKNLSLTGMFVQGKFWEQEEEDCNIRIFHKEKSANNCLRASGKVVWSNDEGAGLQFTAMTFENYMLLLTTLINKADRPAIILREFPKNSPFEITGL
jgi:hypothetical protein